MRLNPVTLEILGGKMAATADEMGITLQRTGRTLYVKEAADFGAALMDTKGKFFAYPHGIGVCCYVDLDCSTVIDQFDHLRPGDVIVTNHPYTSGGMATHTPDLTLIKPYFAEGRIVCYGWAFVHMTDMGGRVPSSISPTSTELFQEGLLVPPLHLMREGRFVDEVVMLLKANVRTPEDNHGDLNAMLAALAVGERRVAEMVSRFGADSFVAAQVDIVEYAAEKARAVLRTVPDGTYEFWDYMDDDARTGIPIRLRVTVTVQDGKLDLDFRGTDPQVEAPYNIPSLGKRHAWLTLRLAAFVYSHDKTVPLNAGIFESVTVRTKPGTVVDPVFPAPVGIRHATAGRVYEIVNGALASAIPNVVPACNGGILIPVVLAEHDPQTGARNVLVVEPMVGGMGARHGADGVDGRDSSIANLRNNPIESVEASSSVRILEYGLRPDSGGPGRWRGGVGLRLLFEILRDGSMVLGRGVDRIRFAPWGLAGGAPGRRARLILDEGQPGELDLGKIDVVRVDAGQTITVLTPGGGGFGSPLERDPNAVAKDVRLGLLSNGAALCDYGVVIVDRAVDAAATQQRRERMGRSAEERPSAWVDTERRAWEDLFDDRTMSGINERVMSLALPVRAEARRRAIESILPGLVQGASVEALHADLSRARRAAAGLAAEQSERCEELHYTSRH